MDPTGVFLMPRSSQNAATQSVLSPPSINEQDDNDDGKASLRSNEEDSSINSERSDSSDFDRWLANRKDPSPLPDDVSCHSRSRALENDADNTIKSCTPFRGLRRRNRKKDKQENAFTLHQEQVEELGRRLQVSQNTSQELRQRLAMLCRYYENIIRRLEEELRNAHANQAHLRLDVGEQMAQLDLDKRQKIARLEQQLANCEMELKTYKTI